MPEPLTGLHSAIKQTVAALRAAGLAVDANTTGATLGVYALTVAPPPFPPSLYEGSGLTARATNVGVLSSDVVATDDQGNDVVSVINMPTGEHWHLVVKAARRPRSWKVTVEPLELLEPVS